MQLTEITFANATPIDGYGPGFFRVGGRVITGNALITETSAGPWTGFDDTQALLALADLVDVIFVGTGPEIAPLPKGMRAQIEDAGMGVETMSTPAACRTYNVLLSEGRRVAAALIAV